eukprot:3350610-Lingulodinium_polyedra.AAC.1
MGPGARVTGPVANGTIGRQVRKPAGAQVGGASGPRARPRARGRGCFRIPTTRVSQPSEATPLADLASKPVSGELPAMRPAVGVVWRAGAVGSWFLS